MKCLGRLHAQLIEPMFPWGSCVLMSIQVEGRDCVLVGLVVPTTELTDITEGICTGGPGSTGMVCPLARCMTRGREPVGDLEDT